MFVVPTYLGTSVDDAPGYVYYVQGKTRHQDQFTAAIENRLFEIGRHLGPAAHLFAPHSSATDLIASEVRQKLGHTFFDLANRTPGFLILRTQLTQYDPTRDEGLFVSLANDDWSDVLDEVERVIVEQAIHQRSDGGAAQKPSVWQAINKRVQIAINLGPISIGTR